MKVLGDLRDFWIKRLRSFTVTHLKIQDQNLKSNAYSGRSNLSRVMASLYGKTNPINYDWFIKYVLVVLSTLNFKESASVIWPKTFLYKNTDMSIKFKYMTTTFWWWNFCNFQCQLSYFCFQAFGFARTVARKEGIWRKLDEFLKILEVKETLTF